MRKTRWAAACVLVGLLVGVLGAKYYGYEKIRTYTAGTGAETITAAGGRNWTWPEYAAGCRHVIVQLSGAATGNLYCRVNQTTANASSSEWDFYLEPGQSWDGYGGTQLSIESMACFADADPGTEGTTYIVKGVD